jgi:hypothetical protein
MQNLAKRDNAKKMQEMHAATSPCRLYLLSGC